MPPCQAVKSFFKLKPPATRPTRTDPDRPPDAGDWLRYGPLDLEPALTGALAAFVERGYAGATMRDVGRHAGLSVPGLYHHHASKQDLLVAPLDLGVGGRARCAPSRRLLNKGVPGS